MLLLSAGKRYRGRDLKGGAVRRSEALAGIVKTKGGSELGGLWRRA